MKMQRVTWRKAFYIIACLLDWNVNPWDKDKNILRSFESGFLASKVLIADFNSAKNDGEIQIVKYFEERIKSSEKLITQTIPRIKCYILILALTALIQAAQKSAIDLEQVMKSELRIFHCLYLIWMVLLEKP